MGVSSAQMTAAVMISAARISMFAAATAAAARASMACTNPSEGRMPDSEAMISAQRATGTWRAASKNTHHAWMFSP